MEYCLNSKKKIFVVFAFVNLYLLFFIGQNLNALDMDVKCTIVAHSDDENGDNVNVRILVLGLKPNSIYTAHVTPDKNASLNITKSTDRDGIFWVIAQIPNGERSLIYRVTVREGSGITSNIVASGDDDSPCYRIRLPKH